MQIRRPYQNRASLDAITRRVDCKFNCNTFDRTQQGIYVVEKSLNGNGMLDFVEDY